MAEFYGRGRVPQRRCMPPEEWPAEYRERWLAAIAKGDILDGSGSRAHVRQITNRKIEKGFGRFLTFLGHADMDLCAVISGRHPCSEIILPYVEELRFLRNSSATIISRLQELHDALSAIYPEFTWTLVKAAARRIRMTAPTSDIKRSKMVAADDLFSLGVDLMQGAGHRSTPRLAAIDFRDGLIIALLALRPLRLQNFAELELGRSLLSCGDTYRIVFDGSSMKNGSPFEAPWPLPLNEFLRRWIETHRPMLASRRGRWAQPINGQLWVSSHGSPMTRQALYDRICARTKRLFGNSVNPHLFRDVAATTLAIQDPEHVRLAAPLLSHRDFRVTEKHYIQARMLTATDRYQAHVSKLRRSRK